MEVIVISTEAYQKLISEMKLQVKQAVNDALANLKSAGPAPDPDSEWITLKEAGKLLKMKRDKINSVAADPANGIVTSRPGRKILFKRASLLDFLQRSAVPAHNPDFRNRFRKSPSH